VARLVGDGLTNAEVAKALGIAVSTVKNHLWSAYRKTGAENRVQLARWLRTHAARDAVGGCEGGARMEHRTFVLLRGAHARVRSRWRRTT